MSNKCDGCGETENDVVGCVEGDFRCQNCCFEDGFDPFTGDFADEVDDINSEDDE